MNSCKNCGGRLIFSPEDKGNKCNSCGTVYEIEYVYSLDKTVYDDTPAVMPKIKTVEDRTQVKCNSCGANIILEKHMAQSICPYCASSEIVSNTPSGMIKIDSILPFVFNKSTALEKFVLQAKNTPFAKTSVLNSITEESLHGIYVNTFLFDLDTSNTYTGKLAKMVRKVDSEGKTKYETKYFMVSGKIDHAMNNISIEVNSNLNQNELNKITPYDYTKAVKYKNEFMNGYLLEYQEKMLEDAYIDAKKIMEAKLLDLIVKKHGADRAVSMKIDMHVENKKYNYCLLPVYLLSINKDNNTHRILINGQNAKVSHVPKSGWKIFGFISAIIAIIACALSFLIFI